MNWQPNRYSPSRRAFMVASATGFAGLQFGTPKQAQASEIKPAAKAGKAKSVILFFLCGGASHVDTWDMKPDAPDGYRGPFAPIQTSAPGVRFCEHLPMVSKQAHHMAVINSVGGTVNTNDHHAGYYYNLTGHVPDTTFLTLGNDRRPYSDDWPFMGSVIAAKKATASSLPGAITLPHKPSKAPYTRPGQFAARLGVEFDPLYVSSNREAPLKFHAPALVLSGDITAQQMHSRTQLLSQLDGARREFDKNPARQLWEKHQQRTLDLLLSSAATKVFDVESEPAAVRERYGKSVNAMSLLVARRLVEAEVPFVTVFWKEDTAIKNQCKSAGGWDTHGNNFNCLKDHLLPEFDQAYSALLEDLHQKGLLDETLVIVTSEMGRTPKIGDVRSGGVSGAGRDHWTHCQSVLMAGGGVQGGQVYGSSDRLGAYPEEHPVTPADIAKTAYYATGVNDLRATDSQGRPYNLLDEGEPIKAIF
ncbi:hypothetical protein FF011L_02310 [Roseimaritima multifibrata]|uniref:Sulfatase n=1 Tax=Roseimaritima multifibrata TaxID=1930274 RepID=A0A517M9I9_9BACT|nr:DUF1501 domain-containing protein [Roseimaritima multifibrata]QDS91501.1 hypothetical protein FF011L_02310 [Roseimaritima multifibrata]